MHTYIIAMFLGPTGYFAIAGKTWCFLATVARACHAKHRLAKERNNRSAQTMQKTLPSQKKLCASPSFMVGTKDSQRDANEDTTTKDANASR